MRSTARIGSGAALGLSLLGISLGAALAGLVALGGSGDARAQGMMMMGESPPKAKAYRPAKKKAAPRRFYYRGAVGKTCGQFKYWSKGKCLDARTTPPKLN
jgi:hypothetical protein